MVRIPKDFCALSLLFLKALLKFACFFMCFYGFNGKSDVVCILKDFYALSLLFLKALLKFIYFLVFLWF